MTEIEQVFVLPSQGCLVREERSSYTYVQGHHIPYTLLSVLQELLT